MGNLVKNLIAGTLAVSTVMGAGLASAETIKGNIFFPDTHPLAQFGYLEWAKILEQESKGELTAKVYTGTVLLPPRSGMSGVRDGIVDVGYHAATYTPAELPITNAVQEMGLNYSDPLVMIAAATDFNMTNPDALSQWQKAGMVFTGGYSTPPYNLMCRMPVRSLSDLKGKRLRTAGAAMSRWVEEVGAVPVNIPSSEMYQGVEKGTLDCAVNVANDLKSRSLWDVAKHTTMAPLGLFWSGPMWGFNQERWDGLSAEQRAAVLRTNAKSMAMLYVGYQASIQQALDEAESHGVTIYQPSGDMLSSIEKFAEANLGQVYATAKEKYGVENPEEVLGRFDQKVKKWESLFAAVDRKDADAIAAIIQTNLYDGIDTSTYGVR
ncbi:C4-dicarboxylate TRAP transporter substrate-binding protein [Sneathiella chinensis]|nr:C4-dicarboxylate TRAP transporter substrate-binding protein [Sneathiella chinensis]